MLPYYRRLLHGEHDECRVLEERARMVSSRRKVQSNQRNELRMGRGKERMQNSNGEE